jgi:hypothetical protein
VNSTGSIDCDGYLPVRGIVRWVRTWRHWCRPDYARRSRHLIISCTEQRERPGQLRIEVALGSEVERAVRAVKVIRLIHVVHVHIGYRGRSDWTRRSYLTCGSSGSLLVPV